MNINQIHPMKFIFGCKSRADGEADARRFLVFLSGKQFDMPVYIDFEAPNATNKNGNTNACIVFCRVMEKAGYFAGVYASDLSGFRDKLNRSSLKSFTWWVACCTWATANLGIWQYSSSGRVNGISGDVDMDECYIDYPTTIRNGGFNGYKAGTKPTAPVAKPVAPKPASKPVASSAIKVGDRIKVTNPITWAGQRFKLWYSTYTVMELHGQRAVVGVNGTVTAAINVGNLRKV